MYKMLDLHATKYCMGIESGILLDNAVHGVLLYNVLICYVTCISHLYRVNQ